MLTDLQLRLKRAGRWLPVALLPLLPFAAQAQTLNYAPANVMNVPGTFTDLGTTGTVISTTSTDDANSTAQNIGFTFSYNGGTFTQFVLNTNGLIRLGSAAPSVANLFFTQDFSTTQTAVDPIGSTNAADVNLLMPFNTDLVSGTSPAEYRVITTGTAGSQVCTIQWKNVSDKTGTGTDTAPTQYSNFTFQVKLYEGTNNVEFVYGPTTPSTNVATSRFPTVGIKGSNATSSVLGNKTTGAGAWSTTVFINGPYGTSTHNYRNAAPPDLGRTYRFVPTVLLSSDAAVTSLYTLGKVAPTFNSPTTAQAVITNTGSTAQTNLPVTLTVSGATTQTVTQTVATLAPGASTTVNFSYTVAATTGTNTLTVTIPADGLASNNTQTATQAISAADQSYIQGATYVGGVGLSFAGNILAVRYTTTSASATISTVTPTFIGAAATGVTSTYQILIYSAGATGQPGAVLYTSPVLTRPTITGATTATPAPISVPGIAVSGTFFVAIKTIGADNIGIGYQTESPLRAGTFFYTVDAGTTWNDLNTQTISPRIALDMTFGTSSSTCPSVTGLAVGSITNTTASVTFTAPAGATGYIVTYTPTSGGTATTVTPAPTASPVALTGLTAGTSYTVSVTNNCGTGNTSGVVSTTFTTTGGSTGPANDNCANAIALTVGSTCTNTVGTNAGATASPASIPAPSCGNATTPGLLADVWYTVTVPAGGNMTITTSAVTSSLLDDTVLEVYSGTCGALTSVDCNDDDPNGTDGFSTLILTGQTPGATLYVRVRSYGTSDTGQFNICATNTIPCGDPSAASIGGATNTSLQLTFTPGAGNTSYNVTYTSGSTVTTITPAPTTSPITITGLTPGTAYVITLQGVCANGTGAILTGSASTTGTPPAATYVSLPYSESFEGTWVNGLSTRDLPTVNWRNSPAIGDRSWRRNDDGTSAAWRYLTGGPYTPAASVGTHSARFHTYGSPDGSFGFLDLYVNMSATGSKTLTFDYINPSGSDSLRVFLSTDGGATFAATPLRQLGVSTTFAPVQPITITSTSATTVIRFQAKSDFGNDDLGIDNLRLALITATRNEALAATVGLYPNPAHQSFQLSVPAGSLHNASASLSNALGQVVLTRQLNLPAAGGTADFNVSNLAAGVYSLTLKSGNDLVVKRVVVE